MSRMSAALVVVTLCVAVLGGWIGARVGEREARGNMQLDVVLHRVLDLTPAQRQQMDTMEARFAGRRQMLETQMRASNRDLARAIVTDRRMSPAAVQAIDRFHEAMRELQELTTAHVLDMRSLLTPQQAVKFDQTIVKVLGPEDQ